VEVWDLNLRHLRAIAFVAELGTIKAAAAAVNLTQPAITQALGRIEEMIGLPLFERRHDGMVPTDAARLLVPRIQAALDQIPGSQVTMSRLRALLALADGGSYAAASVRTGLAVPSLHRSVSDLALSVRKPLVERRGKAVMLTKAGAQLAREFRLAHLELGTGLTEIEALKGNETRKITIGAMPLSRARVLPAAVARFLRRHPRVKIAIIEGSRAELIEPLRNGAVDFTVGALRDPLIEPDLVQQPLFDDRPIVIGRPGHPLAGTNSGIADLAAYPWVIAAPGAPLRDTWERLFRASNCELPPVPVESGSAMIIRQMIIESDFLTLLSPDQMAVELAAGWLIKISDLPQGFSRTIGITTRDAWRPTLVQADFLTELRRVADDYAAS
jgi:LysR family transcriptional regulator, regulator for genes of the gallate degradation pathway